MSVPKTLAAQRKRDRILASKAKQATEKLVDMAINGPPPDTDAKGYAAQVSALRLYFDLLEPKKPNPLVLLDQSRHLYAHQQNVISARPSEPARIATGEEGPPLEVLEAAKAKPALPVTKVSAGDAVSRPPYAPTRPGKVEVLPMPEEPEAHTQDLPVPRGMALIRNPGTGRVQTTPGPGDGGPVVKVDW